MKPISLHVKWSLAEVKDYLRENLQRDSKDLYGLEDARWIERAVNNWFEDSRNYDGRWTLIRQRMPTVGKVLDMAAGCGTFVLFGLQNGYEVWGIEPQEWKREYYKRKILASAYPSKYLYHLVGSVGESLPFVSNCFDLVTSYQTLEHVDDIELCLREMLRVLQPGGFLHLRAPDYNCLFEPHYRIPFLPKMNRKLASFYLRLLGRPTLGLKSLNWTTEKEVVQLLMKSNYSVTVKRARAFYFERRKERINRILPGLLCKPFIISSLNHLCEFKADLRNVGRIGREERVIDLWVKKAQR